MPSGPRFVLGTNTKNSLPWSGVRSGVGQCRALGSAQRDDLSSPQSSRVVSKMGAGEEALPSFLWA